MDCESLTPTQGATQQSVDCESPTPTRGATQQSVDCESLTPKRGSKKKKERKWEAKLHSRGSPTKGRKIRSVPQQRGTKSEVAASRGPKRGRKCYITPAFSGIPNIGEQNQKWMPHPYLLGGPKEGGSATSPLHARGSPKAGDRNKSGPQKGGSATPPLCSRGPQTRGQSQRWPTSGRK